VRRPDFDPSALGPWLARFVDLEEQVWSNAPPDPATLDASQNARSLLRSFHLLLSLPAPGTSGQAVAAGGETTAREKVLATLGAIRR
jgi:hypothetical protein